MTTPVLDAAQCDRLIAIWPGLRPRLPVYLPLLADAEINTPLRLAHFMAQISVESAGFTRTRENLNYSVELLLETFGRHRISHADAEAFGRKASRPANIAGIANALYGGEWGRRHLGNTQSGDGWRFLGRGDKQLTGRDNYTRFDDAMGLRGALLQHPERLEQIPLACASAVWFWVENRCNRHADEDNAARLTETVNGGRNALAARRDTAARLLKLLAA